MTPRSFMGSGFGSALTPDQTPSGADRSPHWTPAIRRASHECITATTPRAGRSTLTSGSVGRQTSGALSTSSSIHGGGRFGIWDHQRAKPVMYRFFEERFTSVTTGIDDRSGNMKHVPYYFISSILSYSCIFFLLHTILKGCTTPVSQEISTESLILLLQTELATETSIQ